MNGKEQAARHSRLNDLETVVEGLAAEMVRDREQAAQWNIATRELRVCADLDARRLDAVDQSLECRLDAFEHRTVWQRLRWLVQGA